MKQSILLSALFGLLLVGSSFIYFSSDTVLESVVEEAASLSIDIDYPETMRVGEEFTLKVNSTEGFEAVPGSATWVVLGSSKGLISVDGSSLATAKEPTVRGVRPGKVDLLLTAKNQIPNPLTQETKVNQIVTIQVLR